MLEAARIGYAVRDTHIADPKALTVDVAKLLDKAWAKTAGREDRSEQARGFAEGADAGQ